ncbi:DUF2189 domain-containing protein [Pseudaminobacter sp. 19-2017]|uniref:DUF2189 domain-containing protein n=1 Tax=Pseudaminobacter soli (ex Zhang et al. 2022) TaxID=2831468 RepID=A0A942E064_9HYPH|nr:DUF2189 domain-containing protein [Pseudaminobacter soli]MBS3650911.1 DUF2189 domain-containing protein [Pseudaminobacter soli]
MAGFHVIAGAGERIVHPQVRRIDFSDLTTSLSQGFDDFMAKPSHVMFIVILYPLVGVFLANWTSGNALPMLFPLMSGFALLGPLAAIGLYEISRRRELGLDPSWRDALAVRHSPALPSIMAVGVFLGVVFIAWLLAARGIYIAIFGYEAPSSLPAFISEVLRTSRGWELIITGGLVGFLFAMLVLCTTVITFPLLLDRDIGAYEAMAASIRAVLRNPIEMMAWGLIVAVLLAVGLLTVFAGLIIVIPVLGHATWHLYRKVVEPDGTQPI